MATLRPGETTDGENRVELERREIERTDFSHARRGYDTQQVDRHLAEIAAAVEELRRSQEAQRSASTVAGAAADRVKSIVDAAEQSAATIESEARAEADRTTGDAKQAAERTRARAESDAATYLAKVEETSQSLLARAHAVESELDALQAELAAMRSELTRAESAHAEVYPPDQAAPEEPSSAQPEETGAEPPPAPAASPEAPAPQLDGPPGEGVEGARLVALNMALNGTPRDETARYLDENFALDDRDRVLDEAYARVKR